MKSVSLVGGGLALGITIGVLIAPAIRPADDHPAKNAVAGGARNESGAGSGPGDDLGSSRRSSSRAPQTAKKSSQPRVSLPMSEVGKLLQSRMGSLNMAGFSPSGDVPAFKPEALEEAFTLLGATDVEKEKVVAVFSKVTDRLREAEIANVKIAKVTSDQVELDISGMAEAVKTIGNDARNELRGALPDARGQVLEESVSWDRIYGGSDLTDSNQAGGPPGALQLKVGRSSHGLMAYVVKPHGGFSGTGIDKDQYVDDGSPIPADKVFGKRWQHWLAGKTLVPAPEP